MADVFVSYSRRDKARVAPLVAAIEARGWTVWWDPEIAPGQEFDRLIDAELAKAAAVLVVWTPTSVESRWVRGEAREAADRGILVPVRYDEATLPIDVRAFHTIDIDPARLAADAPELREMLRALGERVSRGAGPDAAPSLLPPIASARAAPGVDRAEICVLPFANMSGDPAQDYLADGLTEDIITELSRWHSLAVRSRAASFRYRGIAVDMHQVARELGVRFIVEGSVRRLGDRVRISVQLIDTDSGSHVWAEKFDRGVAEFFEVQDEVVRRIVSTLVGRVRASDAERAGRKPPASLAAYECVLKGNALSWSDPAGAAEATRLFERAIELDPGYGLAHALLANMRAGQWYEDYGEGADALLDEAHALARRAVALDENESTCFSLLAQVCLDQRAFDLALQFMRRSVELNPTNQWNTADMGLLLGYLCEPEEALAWLRRAREIDPYFEAAWYWRSIGLACMQLGRDEEALAAMDHALVRNFRLAAYRAACHARLGRDAQARRHAADCLALKPDFTVARFMAKEPFRDQAVAGQLAEALRRAGLPP